MEQNRLDFLDALRGIAIIGVVMVHSGQKVVAAPDWFHWTTAFGARGVQLFFIVSAVTLLAVYSKRGLHLADFLTRRFFRLAPMFYIGIVLYGFIYGLEPRYYAPNGITAVELGSTFLFLHGWNISAMNGVVPGGWSIAAEASFYLLFPLLLWLVRSFSKALALLVLSVPLAVATIKMGPGLLAGLAPKYLLLDFCFFTIMAQLPAFAMGFAIFHSFPLASRLPRWVGMAATTAGTIGVIALIAGGEIASNYLLAIIPLGLIVWGLSQTGYKWSPRSFLCFLGRISFSVYIVQRAAIDGIDAAIDGRIAEPFVHFGVLFGVAGIVSAAAAAVTYNLIERPAIRLGRYLIQDWRRQSRTATE